MKCGCALPHGDSSRLYFLPKARHALQQLHICSTFTSCATTPLYSTLHGIPPPEEGTEGCDVMNCYLPLGAGGGGSVPPSNAYGK
eukprot:jgi/Botrbrau1/4282/Bobra.0390s0022.1